MSADAFGKLHALNSAVMGLVVAVLGLRIIN
jgi:hypothetical protein